jgi:hypothetical protein
MQKVPLAPVLASVQAESLALQAAKMTKDQCVTKVLHYDD